MYRLICFCLFQVSTRSVIQISPGNIKPSLTEKNVYRFCEYTLVLMETGLYFSILSDFASLSCVFLSSDVFFRSLVFVRVTPFYRCSTNFFVLDHCYYQLSVCRCRPIPVSYTHLDVYKRQTLGSRPFLRRTPLWFVNKVKQIAMLSR